MRTIQKTTRRRYRDEEADVEPLRDGIAPEDVQLRGGCDLLHYRHELLGRILERPTEADQVACPIQSAIQLSMIVVITSWAPTVALRNPAMPAQTAPARRRAGKRAARAARARGRQPDADPDRRDGADDVLALAADVEKAAAERERDGEPGEDQSRRNDQCLLEVECGQVALALPVTHGKNQFSPVPVEDLLVRVEAGSCPS